LVASEDDLGASGYKTRSRQLIAQTVCLLFGNGDGPAVNGFHQNHRTTRSLQRTHW